jgi:hypothetical protein
MPNVVINDMPGMTAKHGNHRQSSLFQLFDGRFVENTDTNIAMLKEGTLEVSIPYLQLRSLGQLPSSMADNTQCAVGVHPVTNSSNVYCAVDRFHSNNIKTDADKLRNVKLVKELRGHMNSQVQEQFFSQLRKDIYFLSSLAPTKFLFLVRLLIHFRNCELWKKQQQSVEQLLNGTGLTLTLAEDGRLTSSCTASKTAGSQGVTADACDAIHPRNVLVLSGSFTMNVRRSSPRNYSCKLWMWKMTLLTVLLLHLTRNQPTMNFTGILEQFPECLTSVGKMGNNWKVTGNKS